MKKSLSQLMKMLGIFALLIVAPQVMQGQLLFSEDFNYGASQQNLTLVGTGWTAHSGAGSNSIKYLPASLTFPGYSLSLGGSAFVSATSGEDINKNIGTAIISTPGISYAYASFLVRVNSAQNTGDYIFHFSQTTGISGVTIFAGKVFIKSTTGGFNFGISKSSNTGANVTYSSNTYNFNQTYLAVVKYTFNPGTANDLSELFIINNTIPTSEPAPTVSATIDVSSADLNTILGVCLRQGTAANTATATFDGINVGLDWNSTLGVQAVSSAKSITSFTIANTAAIINGLSITATVPSNIILSNTTATGTISANASISPSFASVTNFSSPVLFTVTAQDLSSQVYTVTAVNALSQSSAKTITGFSISGQISSVINGNIINVTVPFGTNLTSLSPTITVSPLAAVNPASGAATNFSSPPVNYAVTAEDGTTNIYQVTVVAQAGSTANSILTFSIGGQVTSQINGNIINVTVPFGTNLTSLTPSYTISANASASPASGVANNFSSAVDYVVTAQAGGTNSYSVVVSLAPQVIVTGVSPKNILVLRVGDGISSLSANGNSVFVDQYTNSGTVVSSTNISSSINYLISGTAASEGALTLSPDGQYLAFAGYNLSAPHTSSVIAASAATVPRAIASLNGNAGAQIEATTNSSFSANNIRGAVKNGVDLWAVGANSGVVYLQAGPTTVSGTISNNRVINIFNNNLYFSTGSGTRGIYSITGTPTSGATTAVNIIATGANSSPYGFSINPTNSTLYYADDASTANGGGIKKYTFSAGAWSFAYDITTSSTNFRGLTVDWSASSPILYAVDASTTGRLIKFVDNGAGNISSLVITTGGTNQALRGVAFAPTGSITGFTLPSQIGATTFSGNNISIILPAGSSLTSLTPTVTKTFFGNVSPTGAQNFSSPVQYVVDGVNTYTVSITLSTAGSNVNTYNAGSWSQGTPASGDAVLVTGNLVINGANAFNTGNTIATVTVAGGGSITVNDGQSFTVSTSLVNNGSVTVNNLGAFLQNGAYSGSGTFTVNKTGSSNANNYNYWCSPVSGLNFGSLAGGNKYTFVPSLNDWTAASGSVAVGQGYIATGAGSTSFSGTPNNGSFTTSVSNAGSSWNLIGNPYPSGLSFNAFAGVNSANITGPAYFWSQKANSTFVDDYSTLNAAGVGNTGNGSAAPSNIIGTGQGFFVNVNSGTTLSYTNSMRSASNTALLRVENPFKLFRMNMIGKDQKNFNQVTIGFADDATDGFDRLYEAKKRKGNPNLSLASKLDTSVYAIQFLAPIATSKSVPLSIDLAKAGSYTFKSATFENFEANTSIKLVDALTGDSTELSGNDSLVVDITEGKSIDRFSLVFKTAETNVATPVKAFDTEKSDIYSHQNTLYVRSAKDKISHLVVRDITGKVVLSTNVQTGYYPTSLGRGIYLVSLSTDQSVVNKKIILE